MHLLQLCASIEVRLVQVFQDVKVSQCGKCQRRRGSLLCSSHVDTCGILSGNGKLKVHCDQCEHKYMYRCRVIRHKDILSSASYGTRDKFRLHVWDQNHKSVIGMFRTINVRAN